MGRVCIIKRAEILNVIIVSVKFSVIGNLNETKLK